MENKRHSIILSDAIEYVTKNIEENGVDIVNSGFGVLDNYTRGWYPGEFCIVGGRPMMGKTSFVLSSIANIVTSNIPVAFFSAKDDMNLYFMSRIISCIEFENDTDVFEHKLNRVKNAKINHIPLFLNLQPKLSLSYIREQCEYLVKEKGVKIIFIETIQTIFDSEDNGNSKEGMEMICHRLKCMASELNVPVVVTSDLNRSTEHREGVEGKKPQIQDLRSSSAIENNADSIYLLFRPEYYCIYKNEEGKDLRGVLNVIIAKKKYSNLNNVEIDLISENGRIYSINDSKIYNENIEGIQFSIDIKRNLQ